MLGVQHNPANASNASRKITQVALGDIADMQLHLLSELKSAQISDVPCRKLWSSGSYIPIAIHRRISKHKKHGQELPL
jgi:hypothetical protein